MVDYEFELGEVALQPGATLRNAKLAYKTYGSLNIVMPGQTDLYFPPEDNEYEVKFMPNAWNSNSSLSSSSLG